VPFQDIKRSELGAEDAEKPTNSSYGQYVGETKREEEEKPSMMMQ
jgi:hypothetical protein